MFNSCGIVTDDYYVDKYQSSHEGGKNTKTQLPQL